MHPTWIIATLLIVTPSSIVLAKPDSAAHTDRFLEVGGFIGGQLFSDDIELGNSFAEEQVPGDSFLLGLRLSYTILPQIAPSISVNPSLSIEAEAKLSLGSTGSDRARDRDSFTTGVLGWRAHGLLSLWSDKNLSPHIVVGAGGETLFSDSPFVDEPDTDLALYWGIGGKYNLKARYGVRLDLRHVLTAARGSDPAHSFEGHVGLFYRFGVGAKPELEEQQIPPKNTKPNIPPPPPPPPDADKDGIPDAKDLCPKQPEIINQIDDEDGCPEVDSDGDGLLGKHDLCPPQRKTAMGLKTRMAAQTPITIKTGVADVTDKCPLKPETVNRFQDQDGCPDEVQSAFPALSVLSQEFNSNQAVLALSGVTNHVRCGGCHLK